MSQNSVGAALALRDESASALIESYKPDLAAIMPSHMKPDVFTRLAVTALSRDPKLLAAAQNSPGSLLAALWEASRLGLEPATEQYYLTCRTSRKRGPEIVGMTGYQGEIELIYRAGAVSSVTVEVVRERERESGAFVWLKGSIDRRNPQRWEGPQKQPYHEVDWFEDRGQLCGVYAYAEMKDGSISKVIVLNRGHIEKAKESSQGADGDYSPWRVHEEAMWMKTAAHRLRKWVPTSSEYMREQLRIVTDVQAERAQAAGIPAQRVAGPDDQRTEDDFREMANDAADADELTQVLREARLAGFAQQGDDLFQHFVARKAAIEAQGVSDEVVLGHDHAGDFDADCEACRAEQAKLDQQMASTP